MNLTPEQEAAYSLDYGVSRADLKPEVQAAYDRLLAERRAGPPVPAALPEPVRARSVDEMSVNELWWQFVRRVSRTKGFWIVGAIWAVIFFSFLVYMVLGPGVNFQTLQSDLAKVHLPPGYRLVGQHRAGTDCRDQCSVTQTWAWARSSPRSASMACADALNALTPIDPSAGPNPPVPRHAACDYYVDLAAHSGPGQGKPSLQAIVQPGKSQAPTGFLIELTAYYSP